MSSPIHIVCSRSVTPLLKSEAKSKGIIIHDHDFLRISYTDQISIAEMLMTNLQPLVFTSVKGVEAVVNYIQKYGITMKIKSCYGIRGNTIDKAVQNGFTRIADAENAADLAHVIISKKEKSVLHCTANFSRPELYSLLHKSGINITVCEVYHKEIYPVKVSRLDGVIFFSPSQIDSFLKANELTPMTPAFCIGTTTASHLFALHHKNIITALQTNQGAMFQTVYDYYKTTI